MSFVRVEVEVGLGTVRECKGNTAAEYQAAGHGDQAIARVDIRVLAFGLAAGILLDATVIRSLLVPALVTLFGRWNWWMPARLERVLRVAPAVGSD